MARIVIACVCVFPSEWSSNYWLLHLFCWIFPRILTVAFILCTNKQQAGRQPSGTRCSLTVLWNLVSTGGFPELYTKCLPAWHLLSLQTMRAGSRRGGGWLDELRRGGAVSWMECTFRTACIILHQREFHQDLRLRQRFHIFVLGLFRCAAIDAFLGPELAQVASTMSHFLSTVGAVERLNSAFPLRAVRNLMYNYDFWRSSGIWIIDWKILA